MKQTFKQVEQKLTAAGFDLYLSTPCNARPEVQHEIHTCTGGEFSGEVVDLFYIYGTGEIIEIHYSTQFKCQSPKFSI